MKTVWTHSLNSPIYRDALTIRKKVFIDEQKIDPSIEINGEEQAYYFVTYIDSTPVATCRIKHYSKDYAKLQRFAVLKNYRKKTVGSELLNVVESFIEEKDWTTLILDAQEQALPFYLKHDYKKTGEMFNEIDIPHYPLSKTISVIN